MRPANGGRRYNVTSSLIGEARTQSNPWNIISMWKMWIRSSCFRNRCLNGWHFADGIFKRICWIKTVACWFWFYWSFFPRIQLAVNKYSFCWWFGAEQATRYCPNQWKLSSLTRTSVTRRQRSCIYFMMTSLNENISRITGPLWWESNGDQWIPLTKACDA